MRASNAPETVRAPLIDLLKAGAAQLIVWHHLIYYGPMSDVVQPHAADLFGWLTHEARLVVQVFLVIGGYLAAQSLLAPAARPKPPLELVWRRYLRLALPYGWTLLAVLLSAALARELMQHEATPAPPDALQLLAHLLLLQDVLGFESLSAGFWYVAIDLQLYVLAVGLMRLARTLAARTGLPPAAGLGAGALVLVAQSLYDWNLVAGLDVWAPYFFGAYGAGMLAFLIGRLPRWRWQALGGLMLLFAGALWLEWRDRIVVAAGTAALLAVAADLKPARPGVMARRVMAVLTGLAERSYALFLIHYPVCLAVNALVTWLWDDALLPNALGLAGAWLASLAAAEMLHRHGCRLPWRRHPQRPGRAQDGFWPRIGLRPAPLQQPFHASSFSSRHR